MKLLKLRQIIKEEIKKLDESVKKTLMNDGRTKIFFTTIDDQTGTITNIDLKSWLKSPLKDDSSEHSKEQVVKAIISNITQPDKKDKYDNWAKKNNPTFEEKMNYFLKNGLVKNITKRGIKAY